MILMFMHMIVCVNIIFHISDLYFHIFLTSVRVTLFHYSTLFSCNLQLMILTDDSFISQDIDVNAHDCLCKCLKFFISNLYFLLIVLTSVSFMHFYGLQSQCFCHINCLNAEVEMGKMS